VTKGGKTDVGRAIGARRGNREVVEDGRRERTGRREATSEGAEKENGERGKSEARRAGRAGEGTGPGLRRRRKE